jgi:hypothetical protein
MKVRLKPRALSRLNFDRIRCAGPECQEFEAASVAEWATIGVRRRKRNTPEPQQR